MGCDEIGIPEVRGIREEPNERERVAKMGQGKLISAYNPFFFA